MNKYTNKIISVFLVLILALSCMPVYASETAETDNGEVYEILTALGIISDTDMIYYEDIISRAIFIKYALRCSGIKLSGDINLPEGVYTDIDKNTEGYEEIVLAHKMGLISDAALFNPDRNITKPEAAKIMVSLLGYGADAENRGGFPAAYLNMANNLDIFDGVLFGTDGSLDVNSYALLLLNTLNAKPLKIYKVIDDSEEIYSVGRENNAPLMTQTLDIYITKGIVTSNAYASLSGFAKADKGKILIANEQYLADNADAVKYLGLNVEAYYKYDEKQNKKSILYLKDIDNEVITVLSEDIDLNGTTSRSFSYYGANDRKETITGLGSAAFIYNGGLKTINETDLKPTNGAVTFIDNNEDGKYDVIKSENYRTVLVSSVSDLSFSVADSLGGANLDLDVSEGVFDVIITKDGKKADFNSISKDDVISYAEAGTPASGSIIKFVYISTKKAEGRIDSISENIITVEGIDFKASQNVINSSAPGEEGIFYIDMYNRIAVKKAKRDMVYGYIKDKASQSGIDAKYIFKIFTENNRWVELNLAEYVKMIKSDASVSRETASVAYGNIAAGQLVRYKVNSDAEITEIHFAQDIPVYSPGESDAIANDVFRKSLEVCSGNTYVAYRSTVSSFGSIVGLRTDTKIFIVPQSGNDKDFHVVGTVSLRSDESYWNITAYDVDEAVQAGACVMIATADKNAINTVDNESNLMVVKSIGKALTDDGEDAYSLNGAYSGDINAKLRMSPDVEINDHITHNNKPAITVQSLQAGDIIQLGFDSNGYVAKVTRFYNVNNRGNASFCSEEKEYNIAAKMGGIIYKVDHGSYRIVLDKTGSDKGLYSTANLNRVYVYDTSRNIVSLADVSDIENGDYIVAYVRQFQLREAVIVK